MRGTPPTDSCMQTTEDWMCQLLTAFFILSNKVYYFFDNRLSEKGGCGNTMKPNSACVVWVYWLMWRRTLSCCRSMCLFARTLSLEAPSQRPANLLVPLAVEGAPQIQPVHEKKDLNIPEDYLQLSVRFQRWNMPLVTWAWCMLQLLELLFAILLVISYWCFWSRSPYHFWCLQICGIRYALRVLNSSPPKPCYDWFHCPVSPPSMGTALTNADWIVSVGHHADFHPSCSRSDSPWRKAWALSLTVHLQPTPYLCISCSLRPLVSIINVFPAVSCIRSSWKSLRQSFLRTPSN